MPVFSQLHGNMERGTLLQLVDHPRPESNEQRKSVERES
jgi:hypothetical protein